VKASPPEFAETYPRRSLVERSISWMVKDGHRRCRYRGSETQPARLEPASRRGQPHPPGQPRDALGERLDVPRHRLNARQRASASPQRALHGQRRRHKRPVRPPSARQPARLIAPRAIHPPAGRPTEFRRDGEHDYFSRVLAIKRVRA
jgi:hypothetical protein